MSSTFTSLGCRKWRTSHEKQSTLIPQAVVHPRDVLWQSYLASAVSHVRPPDGTQPFIWQIYPTPRSSHRYRVCSPFPHRRNGSESNIKLNYDQRDLILQESQPVSVVAESEGTPSASSPKQCEGSTFRKPSTKLTASSEPHLSLSSFETIALSPYKAPVVPKTKE